jgi:hypothetical protein
MVRASIVKGGRRRDNRKGNIPPSASMTPAAIETAPPERRTNGSSRTPMQDTGRTQQYLNNEPNAFMTFTFLAPSVCLGLSSFRKPFLIIKKEARK